MSKVAITGNASGTGVFTVASPNSNVDRVLTLPDVSGTVLTNSNGKLLVKSEYASSDTDFSTTGSANVVLSANINYEPVSADSEVWVTITAYFSIKQTGSDNDANAVVYAYTFQSNGTTRVSSVGISDGTTKNEIGYVNAEPGADVRQAVTFQGQCDRASNGEVYVRLWGSLEDDATSGYAALLTMKTCDFVFKEYL